MILGWKRGDAVTHLGQDDLPRTRGDAVDPGELDTGKSKELGSGLRLAAPPRPRVCERRQAVLRFEMPEDALAASHPARVLWDVIGTLKLDAFLHGVKAVEGTVGKKTSPRG
jgi:hypothetical protein